MSSLLLALLLTAAEPTERRPVFVRFDAPLNCPPAARYEGELRFRTDRVALVSTREEATAFVTVTITPRGKRFEGLVVVTTSSGRAVTKKVGGPKCESVTAALSLAAALVLDPEGTKLGTVPVELPPPALPEPAPVVATPTPPDPPPEPVVAPQPPPVVVEAPVVVPLAEPSPLFTFSLGAQGELGTFISGNVDVGGGLVVAAASRPLVGELQSISRVGASVGSGRSITAAAGTVGYALHGNGSLETGLGWRFGPVRPELLVALGVTTAALRGSGADEVYSSTRWLTSLGPRARLVAFFGPWELFAGGGLGVSLTREQYLIDPNGVVFSVPPVAATASLGLGRQLP